MSSSQTANWSFDTWFTGFGNPDYLQFKQELSSAIGKAQTEVHHLHVQADAFSFLIKTFEDILERFEHLSNYVDCLFAAHPDEEAIKLDKASIAILQAEMVKLKAALQIKLARVSDSVFEEICADSSLQGAEYAIKRLREEGQLKMDLELEALAADLNINGLHAWGRLYETVSSNLQFEMQFPDGHTEMVAMARRRALMAEPNRSIRQAAFEEGQKPWLAQSEVFAACLNGIAGTRLSLYHHRGISGFLTFPLFENGITEASLEALLEAIDANIELPRRALRASARLQGTTALHYYDLEAPQVAAVEASIAWKEACTILEQALHSTYPKMHQYFCSLLKNRWIEAEPRPGKAQGAFCSHSRWKREERVYLSYYDTVHDLVTLAHEVGHAWHACVLRSKRSMAAHYPMTLAETASNFGEMILLDSLMNANAISAQDRAYLLDQQMLRGHAYLINIPMRYAFEKAFYSERAAGEVPVSRLCALMSQAQRHYYGDTLLPDGTDPLFWASKMHFFFTDQSFYNFPYVVGYLLSQALYARFKEEGSSFLPRYEAFLADTGSASCEEVCRRSLGVDLKDPDFWGSAIRAIEPAVKEYEKLYTDRD